MANKVAVITGGVIRQFIESEVTRQKGIADNLTDDHNHDLTALNEMFIEIVGLKSTFSLLSKSRIGVIR